jgi:hypothetical protein
MCVRSSIVICYTGCKHVRFVLHLARKVGLGRTHRDFGSAEIMFVMSSSAPLVNMKLKPIDRYI